MLWNLFQRRARPLPVAPPRNPIPKLDLAELAKITSYPPVTEGLIAYPTESILATQAQLLERIRGESRSDEEFEQRYWPVLVEFARYVHLLPASQAHHHAGAGGLLRHSLECALYALRASKTKIYGADQFPERRRMLQERFQYACFLAGLMHDAGKPLSDVKVVNRESSAEWEPLLESLYGWAMRLGVDRYFVHFVKNRHDQHKHFTTHMFSRIVPVEQCAWLRQSGDDLLAKTLMALDEPKQQPHNLIARIASDADSDSVVRDQRSGRSPQTLTGAVPIRNHLLGGLQAMIQERRKGWVPNLPGSRIWTVNGSVFLVWPQACQDLLQYLRERQVPSIPPEPLSIADLLIDSGLAVPVGGQGAGMKRYWYLRPKVLAEKNPTMHLQAVCIADPTVLFEYPPQPVEAELLDDPFAPPPASAPPQPPPARDVGTRPAPPSAESDREPRPVLPPLRPPPTPVAPPLPSSTPSAGKPVPAGSALHRPAPDEAAVNASRDWVLDFKPHGQVLHSIAGDIEHNLNDRRRFVLLRNGRIVLSYPEAFENLGFQAKLLVKAMSESGWVENDPETHRVSVRSDTEFDQAIVLNGMVTDHFWNVVGDAGRAALTRPRAVDSGARVAPAPPPREDLPPLPSAAPLLPLRDAAAPAESDAGRRFPPPPQEGDEAWGGDDHHADLEPGADANPDSLPPLPPAPQRAPSAAPRLVRSATGEQFTVTDKLARELALKLREMARDPRVCLAGQDLAYIAHEALLREIRRITKWSHTRAKDYLASVADLVEIDGTQYLQFRAAEVG